MVQAKSKNSVGLGNSLMNDRFGRGRASAKKKASRPAAIARKGQDGEMYLTNQPKDAAWVKMRSITEQAALDEFLSTAELADTDFTAERIKNVKVIHADQKNPYLLSAAEERQAVRKQLRNKERLTIPRRPKWNESTTPQELDVMERESLLEWRRGLAELQENQDLLMTPFERNLEVWRQLWRVIERSDLVVQIVDARNPLLFRCEDLERYVKEVDPNKQNLLLVNKADMMTPKQREMWADYFERNNINYRFFSAQLAREAQLRQEDFSSEGESDDDLAQEAEKLDIHDDTEEDEEESGEEESNANDAEARDDLDLTKKPKDMRTHILTVEELEQLFLANAPQLRAQKENTDNPHKDKTVIGLVGYPNVGKSSTINALLGAKKVSVSATPGKTKHFQTLHLSPDLILCDCPGLVFPNFATTKAELVVNGVLPIDQQREYIGPTGLVANRIPKYFLEAVYGMKIHTRPLEEGGTGIPTASELLRAYAKARGFATTGQGQPDESRAARYILKDYVNGKLLYCHPPPSSDPQEASEGKPAIDPADFNRELYDLSHLPEKRRAQILKNGTLSGFSDEFSEAASTATPTEDTASTTASGSGIPQGPRSRNLDEGFFRSPHITSAAHITRPFNHKYSQQAQAGKQLSGRKQRMMLALEKGLDPSDPSLLANSKKHFKGNKRAAKKKRVNVEDYD
ncbi:hypothetical protein VTN31DRAFT_7249 [Thermomyces dupontii]|uniref:uncharacterized protein n=1 Tax=Talaromyces thermophilus TaxID=28565 RepID=UPI0037436616